MTQIASLHGKRQIENFGKNISVDQFLDNQMIVLEYSLTLLESEFKEAICSGVFLSIGDMPRDAPFRTKFFGQVVFLVYASRSSGRWWWCQ